MKTINTGSSCLKPKPLILYNKKMNQISLRNITYALFLFIFLLTISKINSFWQKPQLSISFQDQKRSLKPAFYNLINLGQRRLLSSIFWIDTLLAPDIQHYKENDLANWMYIRFDTITDLDPLFIQAYENGGLILSVIKDDDLGAINIYQKGLKRFPENINLNFYAGTHALLELRDWKLAFQYLHKIKDTEKAPKYLPSLLSKLQITQGNLNDAYAILLTAYQSEPDGHLKDHFAKNLYALKSERDLNCLNKTNKQENIQCDKTDFDGNYYLLAPNNQYYAPKKWNKSRLSNRLMR